MLHSKLFSSFVVPAFRGSLVLNQKRSLDIKFSSSHLGRFEDRVEFVFRDESLSQSFIIARHLRAVVANQRELDALGPVAPYVRPPRREHRPRGDDVEGVRYPFPSDIKFVAKLGKYDVPTVIREALASGNPEDQLNAIKSRILPRDITAETYSRHWSALLHLEEIQMT
jgi:helicase MOV-10